MGLSSLAFVLSLNFFKINLFIWLCWVFVAGLGLSVVGASVGYSPVAV